MDWKYKTEPQPNRACLGHTEQRCNWPRGRVLGGSSVLNYMLYVRGNKLDYDHWEQAGNPGWGYNHALHYFKKSEDNRNPYLAATPYHSSGGYLTVQEAPWRWKISHNLSPFRLIGKEKLKTKRGSLSYAFHSQSTLLPRLFDLHITSDSHFPCGSISDSQDTTRNRLC